MVLICNVCFVKLRRNMAVESGQRALVRVPSIRSLAKLTQAVAAASDLDGIYSAALGSLSESLGVQRASILLFDPDQTLRVKAWLGLSEEYCRAVEGHTAWTPATTDAQPSPSPDVRPDPSLAAFQETFERERIAALAFIPLVSQRRLLGEFMLCYNQPHDFQEDEILLAQTIASQVALAIDQHNVRRELEQRQHQYKHLV